MSNNVHVEGKSNEISDTLEIILPVKIPSAKWLRENILILVENVLNKHNEFTLYVDGSNVEEIPVMSCVMEMVRFMRKNDELFRTYLRGSSIRVVTSMTKNVLKLLFKIKPPVAPLKLVENKEDGYAFIHSLDP